LSHIDTTYHGCVSHKIFIFERGVLVFAFLSIWVSGKDFVDLEFSMQREDDLLFGGGKKQKRKVFGG
jgi:hypothetical protein